MDKVPKQTTKPKVLKTLSVRSEEMQVFNGVFEAAFYVFCSTDLLLRTSPLLVCVHFFETRNELSGAVSSVCSAIATLFFVGLEFALLMTPVGDFGGSGSRSAIALNLAAIFHFCQ